jgi:LysM repeat protein
VDRLRLVVGRPAVARYAAPLLFLLAVTAVVLVVRGALRSGSSGTTRPTTTAAARAHRPVRGPARPTRYYVIRSGDTLVGIAARFQTTVERLLRLNPGVQATALRPGTELRIR